MKDTQALFTIQKLIPTYLNLADESQPHFSVSVRTDGPWVSMVRTNQFFFLKRGLDLVTGLMDGTGKYHLLVERLVQDKDDDCRYNSTVLVESEGG